jgi:bacillithiol system protein YtxJ
LEELIMIREGQTRQDLEQLVRDSNQRPVFLLKHSTRCPISASAWRAYQRFDGTHPDAALWKVLVIENAPLSAEITRQAGVGHQSPQILLFHRGQVVWHDSHWSITQEAIEDALRAAVSA